MISLSRNASIPNLKENWSPNQTHFVNTKQQSQLLQTKPISTSRWFQSNLSTKTAKLQNVPAVSMQSNGISCAHLAFLSFHCPLTTWRIWNEKRRKCLFVYGWFAEVWQKTRFLLEAYLQSNHGSCENASACIMISASDATLVVLDSFHTWFHSRSEPCAIPTEYTTTA